MKLPNEFKEKYQALFTNFEEFIQGFDRPRSYGLRLNPLKIKDFQNNLYLKNILIKNELVENGYYYDNSKAPGRHPYHHAGVYYIQDPSAMMVIENADIKEHDRVFDMCAAPGGKSTHILAKLNNTGLLICNEIISKRAKILSENIERMGASNAIVISADPLKLNQEFYGFFDKVIVDAPCSGEGMFRKDEGAIEEWSLENIRNCSILQKDLLEQAVHFVKDNGIIVYSTCTFSPEENEQRVQSLLETYPNLKLLPTIKHETIQDGIPEFGNDNPDLKLCSRYYFHKFNGEGHFIAKFIKTKSEPELKKSKSKSLSKASKLQIQLLNEFFNKFIKNFPLTNEIINFNNHLYHLNYDGPLPNLDYINIIRYGLHLGEIKKDRFEPSHSLALALKKEQVSYSIDFSSDCDDIIKYLSGETIAYPGHNQFTLITVDGFSIGWAKHVDDVLKNYYPKGLRIMK